MKTLRSCVKLLMLICMIWQFAASCRAQSYPVKPIRCIVPSTAGGGTDILVRIVAERLTKTFGQQVIVDCRGGAGGNIGAGIAAKAPPDGYTLFAVTVTHAANVSLYSNLSFDLVRDFAPVTQLASSPLVVIVHPSFPATSISELVQLAKAKPGAINYASVGTGRPAHLATELFKKRAGVDMVHVPYKGGSEAQTSVLARETSIYFANISPALPFIKQGKLRALAVTSVKRVPMLPECPTIAETIYPGYQSETWFGLMVPAKTPKAIITTINTATVSALNSPDVSKRLHDLTYMPVGDQPEEFGAYIRSEIAKWGELIRELHLTATD